MQHEEIEKITFSGIILGIIILLGLIIPEAGYPTGLIPGLNITIIHIPVIIGSFVLGKKYGALFGFIFGVTSFITAIQNPSLQAPFTNPLVSVVPRILFAYLVVPVYDLLEYIVKKKSLRMILSSVLVTSIHTILVLAMLYFVRKTGFYFWKEEYIANTANESLKGYGLFEFILTAIGFNGIVEMLLAGMIAPPVVLALNHVMKLPQKKINMKGRV